MTHEEVMKARSAGLNRTNSMGIFKEEVGDFTHSAFLQSVMQQETVSKYTPGCFVKGLCSKSPFSEQQNVLHKLLIKTIRTQISANLPSTQARDYLFSGDVAIAVRCGRGPGCSCRVYLLAQIALRPACAVFACMSLKSSPDSDTVNQATFERNGDDAFLFKTSWELVADLLKEHAENQTVIYVNVLDHSPVFLGYGPGYDVY